MCEQNIIFSFSFDLLCIQLCENTVNLVTENVSQMLDESVKWI